MWISLCFCFYSIKIFSNFPCNLFCLWITFYWMICLNLIIKITLEGKNPPFILWNVFSGQLYDKNFKKEFLYLWLGHSNPGIKRASWWPCSTRSFWIICGVFKIFNIDTFKRARLPCFPLTCFITPSWFYWLLLPLSYELRPLSLHSSDLKEWIPL